VAAPSPPSGSESALLQASLGSKPEMSVFIRPKLARADAYWGPMINRALAGHDGDGDPLSHSSAMMLLEATQIDLHVSVRDPIALRAKSKADFGAIAWVGVFFGLALDPMVAHDG